MDDDTVPIGVTYDAETNEISLTLPGKDTRTLTPEQARQVAADIQDSLAAEMASDQSDLASLVADLEVAADRADRNA